MRTMTRRRDPEIRWSWPIWYHHHGSKMQVKLFEPQSQFLAISGSAADVIIRKASNMHPDAKGWFVTWKVVQFRPDETGCRGRAWLGDEDLMSAFGLSDKLGDFGQWIIERFGADVAAQGKYIRWQNFLNIPCPGTGNDGDPNVSIYVTREIQNAVRQLLQQETR